MKDNKGDLISREALKKVLCEKYEAREHYIGEKMLEAIDNAPTVEYSRPQGEWVNTSPHDDKGECSFCCYLSNKYYNFCPNCGADMRGKMIICVSLDEFIRVATSWIYELAPYHKPRFIDEIVDEIIKRFKADCRSIGTDFFYYEVELKDLYKFIENILMPIDKFRDLNLSPKEYKQGIDVDDLNRPKFQFVSAFDSVPDDDKFVDLDACIQNIFSHYEHNAYRQWLGDEMDTDRLSEFRKEYNRGKEE